MNNAMYILTRNNLTEAFLFGHTFLVWQLNLLHPLNSTKRISYLSKMFEFL